MRGLNPDHLRALTEVVENGSFTRAAKKLNLAQPTVSLQIRELENRLGVRLVERLGKRAFPTAAGRELVDHARHIARETDRLLAAMRRHREGWLGHVRLGSSTTALIYHLPPALALLRRRHPSIELTVTTGTTSNIIDRLLRNEIDLGIISLPVTERLIEAVPLRSEALVAIFSARERNLPARVTPQFLLQHPLLLENAAAHIKGLIMEWLSADGGEVRPAMELDNLEAVKRMVAAGLGASILPEGAVSRKDARADIAARPLKPPLSRTLALVQRRDKPHDPAFRLVREALLKLAADGPAARRSAEP
jgi:DNA-binding transcriptional LysR family regulator